jgi:hypothetical protein
VELEQEVKAKQKEAEAGVIDDVEDMGAFKSPQVFHILVAPALVRKCSCVCLCVCVRMLFKYVCLCITMCICVCKCMCAYFSKAENARDEDGISV